MGRALQIRKYADTSEGRRVRMFDSETGARKLVNPDTPGEDHEPWPLAGVDVVGEMPDALELSTHYVAAGISEGWITGEGENVVFRPSGPANDKWGTPPHALVQYDSLTFHFMSGDVTYKVTHQPDKYVAEGTDKTKVTDEIYAAGETRVDKFYGLKRAGKKG